MVMLKMKIWTVLVYLCTQCLLLRGQAVETSSSKGSGTTQVGVPLILTPLLEEGKAEQARQRSKVNPNIGNTTSYSGYFTVNKQCESNLFFWFFPAQKNSRQAPLMLFLQGGPGASSTYSLFEEVGPITYKENLGYRQYSWNVENNLLFIDQPVGTGFSFTGKGCYAENETVSTNELYSAVVQFHQLFPEFRNNKFIIAGYSYAGHFVHQLGYAIHKNNPSARVKINLSGILIGNGWMDGFYQNDLGSYLYQLGLIDDEGRAVYYEMQEKYSQYIKSQQYQKALEVRGQLVDELYTKYVGNVSILNYLEYNILEAIPHETFIQSPRIRKAIHVGNANYSFINPIVGERLGVAPVLSVKPEVEELLEHYMIVFYNGQLDIICAYPQMVNFLKALNWSGKSDYKNAKRQNWCVDGWQAGSYKNARNLYEVFVRNAGHSVPRDKPLWGYVLANSVASGAPNNPLHELSQC